MNLKLKRVDPLQAGKLLAAFYGLFSLLLVPFMMIAMTVGSLASRQQGNSPPLPLMFGMGVGFMIFLPRRSPTRRCRSPTRAMIFPGRSPTR